MMKLSDLFEGAPDIEIQSLMSDSRVKSPHSVFFCIKGLTFDGHRYIQQAKQNGAVAVVYSEDLSALDPDLIYIRVNNVMTAMNHVAAIFYGNPSQKMSVLGVTGTNGKSTVAWIERYLVSQYEPCGYIGTISVSYGDVEEPEHLTTPDVIELNQILDRMVQHGMKAVAIEASSQGLDRHRVDSIHFAGAAFTNLTEDHFDYHQNFENYFHAKQKLFTMLDPDVPAVINIDDPYGMRYVDTTTGRPVTYSCKQEADYQAIDIRLKSDHTDFNLVHDGTVYPVHSSLVAMFDVYNLVCALAVIHEALGYPLEELTSYCGSLPQVKGRVERIEAGQPYTIIVDYAHTPDGLDQFLSFARSVTPEGKRLIAVFGSAGLRDARKRPDMGTAADRYCDVIILTAEDPRAEDPEEIAEEIQSGIHKAISMIVVDRYEAIRQAIEIANEGDTVVVLGKGDETSMDIGDKTIDWMGDPAACRKALQEEASEGAEE